MNTLNEKAQQSFNERLQMVRKNVTNQSREIPKERVAYALQNATEPIQNVLEKIRGKNNLLSVSYMLRAYEVAQSVGLIWDITEGNKRNASIGTAFLIAPNIIITNHHVIEKLEDVENFVFRLNYQHDLSGDLVPFYDFKLNPNKVFATSLTFPADITESEKTALYKGNLDFTIVGVEDYDLEGKVPLSDFGYLPMHEKKGKITEGEYCNIVQHPDGRPKEIALQENRILSTSLPNFLIYETDTEGGSSGSPVFSNDWLVVALHHAGEVINDDRRSELRGNEGIRVSSIMAYLATNYPKYYAIISQAATVPMKETLPLGVYKYARPNLEKRVETENPLNDKQIKTINPKTSNNMQNQNVIRLNIPIEIRLGSDFPYSDDNETPEYEKRKKNLHNEVSSSQEGDVMSYVAERNGYNPNFFAEVAISLETLYQPFLDEDVVAPLKNGNSHELKYTNFSVVMHKIWRLCIITAVNIEGDKSVRLARGGDKWKLDNRLDSRYQIGNELYSQNPLDRGHMVRREDPNWGPYAEQANMDTFHYTNACPQHEGLNQRTWLNLEDYVLNSARNNNLKISVFTGPVLSENKNGFVVYRQARVPIQFYKIVAMVKKDGTPSITGYLLTQKELIINSLEERHTDEFVYGQFKTFQVSLSKIEEMTKLNLKDLKQYDPLNGTLEFLESNIREIVNSSDLQL